jgi:hypothetical protein
MLAESFRLDTVRLIPRAMRCKQALFPAAFLAALILAGCGSSGAPKAQSLAGPGFRFSAPGGWKIARTPRQLSASHDSELVQVATFPLVKPYRPALFAPVAAELEARMAQVANQVHGVASPNGSVTVAGIPSHSYRVKVADHVDEYTFVLRGLREYQLLCRRRSSSSDEACRRLTASFKLD